MKLDFFIFSVCLVLAKLLEDQVKLDSPASSPGKPAENLDIIISRGALQGWLVV